MQTPDELIAEIRDVQNELLRLKVRRDRTNLRRDSLEELIEIRDSTVDQLKQRKWFLEVNQINIEV